MLAVCYAWPFPSRKREIPLTNGKSMQNNRAEVPTQVLPVRCSKYSDFCDAGASLDIRMFTATHRTQGATCLKRMLLQILTCLAILHPSHQDLVVLLQFLYEFVHVEAIAICVTDL
jgi:hypothetical protein